MSKGVVPWSPKARAVAGKPAVADVHHGDSQLLAQQDFEVAEHVAEACLPGDRHGCACREGFFGRDGGRETKAERGDIAPPQKPAWHERVKDGAQLIARVAGLVGDERVMRVKDLHQVAIYPVRVDGLLI